MRADLNLVAPGCVVRIASSDAKMASPIAVAPSARSVLTAALNAARSVVGVTSVAALPAKLTSPTLYWRGTRSANLSAASWAARSRYGATSSADMDPDVSIANMIVACSLGTDRETSGRASANRNPVNARPASPIGMKRRRRPRCAATTSRSISGNGTE